MNPQRGETSPFKGNVHLSRQLIPVDLEGISMTFECRHSHDVGSIGCAEAREGAKPRAAVAAAPGWRALVSLVLVFSLGTAVGAAAQPAKPSISFVATAVTVSEVPPGHDVLIFSIAREVGQYYATLVRRDKVLSPQPGSRTVNWDLGKPVPPQSVWCAIDLANGETVLASPPGFPLRRIIDAPLISRDSAGAPSRIVHERADAFVIVATPGRGAWILRSGDGGGGDDDPSPGKARVALTRLGPLVRNGAPPPSVLSASDVVVVIDPIYLEVWSGQVGREVQP